MMGKLGFTPANYWTFFFYTLPKTIFQTLRTDCKSATQDNGENEKEGGGKGSSQGEKQLASLKQPLAFLKQ